MIKLKKTYNDVVLKNIFVKKEKHNTLSVADGFRSAISQAKEKICIVLEKGLLDEITKMLNYSQARKYILVPTIEESKLSRISGNMIVREVDSIKGNYAIIDEKELYIFDNMLFGVNITNAKAVKTLHQLFLKEFWINGQAEFISKKVNFAEITFDVPPIYGNDDFLLDESFEDKTEIQKLIDNAVTVGCVGKAFSSYAGSIILKDAKLNKNYLETTTNEDIYLAPDMPLSIVNSENGNYVLNFNPADYYKLPEKGKGRLFAVKCSDYEFGTVYKFFKHKTVEELLNVEVLSVDGEDLHIEKSTEVNRDIDADLRLAREYENMDSKTLEARLEKKYPDIFDVKGYYSEVQFNIKINVLQRTYNKRAQIYSDYINVESDIAKKLKEIESSKVKTKLGIVQTYINKLPKIDTVKAYNEVVENINRVIELINHNSYDTEEEALSEVTGNAKKKQVNIQTLSERKIRWDLPKNGVLYQDGDRFEYVLSNQTNLDAAINEIVEYGIENSKIKYLSE